MTGLLIRAMLPSRNFETESEICTVSLLYHSLIAVTRSYALTIISAGDHVAHWQQGLSRRKLTTAALFAGRHRHAGGWS
jgi:hypothetical protein